MIEIYLKIQNTETDAGRETTIELEFEDFVEGLKDKSRWYKWFEGLAHTMRIDFVADNANILEGAAGKFLCPHCFFEDFPLHAQCPCCDTKNEEFEE